MTRIVIIGNGVAGVTCALKLRELNPSCEILIVGKESEYFFSRTALMYVLMNQLNRQDLEPYEREVYLNKRIELLKAEVTDIDAGKKTITVGEKTALPYDALVLATGARPNFFPWRGLEPEAAKSTGESDETSGIVHFVSMQDLGVCESLIQSTRKAVVIGGGLIGIELAESLRHRGIEVVFLVREKTFWPVALGEEESEIVASEAKKHGVNLILNDELLEVEKDSQGRVSKIKTAKGLSIDCNLLGICIGVRPNVDFLKKAATAPKIRTGIVVNEYLQTSLPDVYACGDCAEICVLGDNGFHSSEDVRGIVELFWYSAKRQGERVAENICLQPRAYRPPTFFNSSKFFSVEYTTVGDYTTAVNADASLVVRGNRRNSMLRILFNKDSRRIQAINILGARVDHEQIMHWIESGLSVESCLQRFKETQFDVEFGRVRFEEAAGPQASSHAAIS
jgi:NADPH-dependent 2,4-dienoyl-CoA reductase/sulfur reductase-like enzyme